MKSERMKMRKKAAGVRLERPRRLPLTSISLYGVAMAMKITRRMPVMRV